MSNSGEMGAGILTALLVIVLLSALGGILLFEGGSYLFHHIQLNWK